MQLQCPRARQSALHIAPLLRISPGDQGKAGPFGLLLASMLLLKSRDGLSAFLGAGFGSTNFGICGVNSEEVIHSVRAPTREDFTQIGRGGNTTINSVRVSHVMG